MIFRNILISFALGASILVARAQAPGSLDASFQTPAGTDVAPVFVSQTPTGKLLAAGEFTTYSGEPRSGIVRLNANGSTDSAFNPAKPLVIAPPFTFGSFHFPGSTNNGSIKGAAVLADGKIIVVGEMTHFGATALNTPNIALLADDGTVLPFTADIDAMEPGFVMRGPGNTVYLGGGTSIANNTRLSLLRLNTDGSRDGSFTSPLLTTLNYRSANVIRLENGPNGTIYANVAALIGSSPNIEFIRLNSDGTLDSAWADSGRANCTGTLSLQMTAGLGGTITLYGAGNYRGQPLQSQVTRLNLDGSIDTTFVPPSNLGNVGRAVVQPDGKTIVANSSFGSLARLNLNGSRDTGYIAPTQLFASTYLTVAQDGSLYTSSFAFSPTFQLINGVYHVLGDPNSAPSFALQPLGQTNSLGARTRFTVTAQGAGPITYQWFRGSSPIEGATQPDLILPTTIATDETEFYCVATNPLGSTTSTKVRLTLLAQTAGSLYRETDVPVGPNAPVNDLFFDAEGGLFGLGEFTQWNTTNRVRLARLLPLTQELDVAFNAGLLPGTILSLNHAAPLAGGKVFALLRGYGSYGGRDHEDVLRVNANGTLDTTFNVAGLGGLTSSPGTGTRPVVGADGKVVLFGSTWNDEFLAGSYIRLNEDGTRDTTFALRGSQYFALGGTIAPLADGRYLVSGRPGINGLNGSGVIRLNANGTLDTTFKFGGPYAAAKNPTQITVLADGRILVSGAFIIPDGGTELVAGLLRLLPDGSQDPEFNPVPRLSYRVDFTQQGILRFGVQTDGKIVGIGGVTAREGTLMRFWQNGVFDPSFQVAAGKGDFGDLKTVAVRSDNAIFVGGSFHSLSTLPRTNIARINSGPMVPAPAAPTIVNQTKRLVVKAPNAIELSVEAGGSGPFQYQWRRNATIGATNMIDIIGATNATFTLQPSKLVPQDSGIYQVAVVNAGGAVWSDLITVLVEPDPALAGTVDTSLKITPGFRGILSSQPQIIASAPGGKLFGSIGTSVYRFLEDGSIDTTFNPPSDLMVFDGGISAVLLQPDGKLVIAGRMKDGMLARLLPNGEFDPAFVRTNRYTGFFQNVPWALAIQSDGRILMGGTFENINGQPVHGLARFLPNGELDASFPLTFVGATLFNPVRTLPGSVISIRMLADDRFYISGGFTHVGETPRLGLARLLPNGAVDPTFVAAFDASSNLGTQGPLTIYGSGPMTPDNGIYVFGTFRFTENGPIQTVLRLRADGTVDTTFNLVTDFQVNNATVQTDGKLVITGQFTKVHGVSKPGFARVNVDGSLDAAWIGSGLFGSVGAAMLTLPDGKIQVGAQRFFSGGVALPPLKVVYVRSQGTLNLTWPTGYSLQKATTLLPANWQTLAVPSPFSAPMTGPGEFYRLIETP